MKLGAFGERLHSEEPELLAQAVKEAEMEYELYKQIALLRKNENITQNELASLLGVSQATVGKFETGKRKNPTIKFLTKIVDALGYKMNITFEKK